MGRQGKTTDFQIAAQAVYQFLVDGTRPDPSIESHHRGPWDPAAPIATGGPNAGSANFRLVGGIVQMCIGGREQLEAEKMAAERGIFEMEHGLGLIEGPFSGYDAIHWAFWTIVHEITESAELRAICRRRVRAQWELIKITGVVRDGVLDAIGPGNRFDQGQAGRPNARQVPSAIASFWARSWHPYDRGGNVVRHPGAAEWLLRSVRLCRRWEDIRDEPLRTGDIHSMARYHAARWSSGARAAWIERGTAAQDPPLLGVVAYPDGTVDWLWLPEWIAGGNPKEGGHGGARAELDADRVYGWWRIDGEDRRGEMMLPRMWGLADSVAWVEPVAEALFSGPRWPELAGLRPEIEFPGAGRVEVQPEYPTRRPARPEPENQKPSRPLAAPGLRDRVRDLVAWAPRKTRAIAAVADHLDDGEGGWPRGIERSGLLGLAPWFEGPERKQTVTDLVAWLDGGEEGWPTAGGEP